MRANHDFPYHDHVVFEDTDEPTLYQVGQRNIDAHGSQRKHFVSKSTLIYSDVACTVRFNNANNVADTILPNVLFTFFCNISAVIVDAIGAGGTLYMYFDGVLPSDDVEPTE